MSFSDLPLFSVESGQVQQWCWEIVSANNLDTLFIQP